MNLPIAPTIGDVGAAPDRPEVLERELPAKPAIVRPYAPALVELHIPEFDFGQLEFFDKEAPEFEGNLAINTVLQWQNQEYEPEVMDEVIAVLRRMWAGQTGLPPAVELALFDRAAAREDLTISRDVSAAFTDFSSRGFTMPPGALVARIEALRADGQRNKLALTREVFIKAAEIHVENMKFACTQAVAAENLLHTIFDNMVRRSFEAAKVELDAQLTLLNAQVAIFNARQSSWAAQAQNRREELATRMAAIKLALEAELAKGKINEQNVALYEAQMRALQVDVGIYEAEMKGAAIVADMDKTRIEAYKVDVSAWAERVNVQKVRADIYDSQMKGEATKANMVESQARAYSAVVTGKVAAQDADIKRVEAIIKTNDLRLRAWLGELDASRTRAQSWLSWVQAQASAYEAQVRGYSAEVGAVEAGLKVDLAAREAETRTAIARYEAEIRKYLADLEQLRQAAAMQLEAIKAIAQHTATMAAGRMAGINIGAHVGGNASINASGSRSDQTIMTPAAL